jgi:WhiB family redox-sensing transcriptional regulator
MSADRYVPPPVIRQRAQAGGWLARAACRGMDPELFFPDRGESTEPAKAVCAACPVRAECLDYALTNGERFGVWGGASERERRALRRDRARAARADRGAAA